MVAVADLHPLVTDSNPLMSHCHTDLTHVAPVTVHIAIELLPAVQRASTILSLQAVQPVSSPVVMAQLPFVMI